MSFGKGTSISVQPNNSKGNFCKSERDRQENVNHHEISEGDLSLIPSICFLSFRRLSNKLFQILNSQKMFA